MEEEGKGQEEGKGLDKGQGNNAGATDLFNVGAKVVVASLQAVLTSNAACLLL